MGTAAAEEKHRMRPPRDRRESVCWTWLDHRFFIFTIY